MFLQKKYMCVWFNSCFIIIRMSMLNCIGNVNMLIQQKNIVAFNCWFCKSKTYCAAKHIFEFLLFLIVIQHICCFMWCSVECAHQCHRNYMFISKYIYKLYDMSIYKHIVHTLLNYLIFYKIVCVKYYRTII